jgi:predicted enzyme related to lactoylglutathione lyase
MHIGLVVIGVSDLDRSVEFYRDVAGFDLLGAHGALAFFKAGPIQLMLNADLRRQESTALGGAMEIVLTVASVAAEHARLVGAGTAFLIEPREVTSGSWAATFADPDGHWLTLFGPQ